MSNVQLTQIVKDVQKDRGQFERLYSQIVNKVYYWCLTTIGNETEANDLTQESMIRIYSKLSTLKDPEIFTTWMYSIARNCCYDYLRGKKKSQGDVSYDDEILDETDLNLEERSPEMLPREAYDIKETKDLIASLIQKLPRRQREIIVLYYLEGFSTEEISEIISRSPNTVRVTLREGRKALKKHVDDYEKQNKVRLHGMVWLPLLGEILEEHRTKMAERQNFHYDEKLYKSKGNSSLRKIQKLMSNNIMTLLGLGIFLPIVIAAVALAFMEGNSSDLENFNPFSAKAMGIESKLKSNDFVADIEYSSFPVTSNLEVIITLKKDMSGEDIKILQGSKEISFQKDGKKVLVNIKENGKYEVLIQGKTLSFNISSINANALQLLSVDNYEDHLKLILSGELSQLDYTKSYVLYMGKNYPIKDDLTVGGQFKGSILIVLYNKDNQYMEYLNKID